MKLIVHVDRTHIAQANLIRELRKKADESDTQLPEFLQLQLRNTRNCPVALAIREAYEHAGRDVRMVSVGAYSATVYSSSWQNNAQGFGPVERCDMFNPDLFPSEATKLIHAFDAREECVVPLVFELSNEPELIPVI